jgi:hypothetical protein
MPHSFFDALDRISADDYLPTVQDVLQARVVTTGIFETQFIVEGVTFQYVAGQRWLVRMLFAVPRFPCPDFLSCW